MSTCTPTTWHFLEDDDDEYDGDEIIPPKPKIKKEKDRRQVGMRNRLL